jgi:hypothetical protein
MAHALEANHDQEVPRMILDVVLGDMVDTVAEVTADSRSLQDTVIADEAMVLLGIVPISSSRGAVVEWAVMEECQVIYLD